MALNETLHDGGFILSVAPGNRSLDNGLLNTPMNLVAGAVLGQLLAAGAAVFVGTVGTRGTVTVSAVIGPAAQVGQYRLVCVAASANAGTFQLRAPDGSVVAFNTALVITVAGGAFTSDHLGITIADGATDFIVGDTYTIDVTGGDWEALDPIEDDGAQIAAGILFGGTNATAADKACVVLVRDAEVNANELTWPAGITAPQKLLAISQLNARGITLR